MKLRCHRRCHRLPLDNLRLIRVDELVRVFVVADSRVGLRHAVFLPPSVIAKHSTNSNKLFYFHNTLPKICWKPLSVY